MAKIDRYLICFLIFSVFCIIFTIFLVALDKIFVLTSPPMVINFYPEEGKTNVLLDSFLVINFDKPIKRKEIQHLISPEVHGEWKFKDALIKNHLFKTLIFAPAVELKPDVQYEVKLENIRGFGLKKSNSFQFTFKTIPDPEAISAEAETGSNGKQIEYNNFSEEKTAKTETEPELTMIRISLDWQDRNLSCEAASLKMALAGKGIFVSETEIMDKIGYDLTPRKENIWGDPYQKYVGDIDGKMCLSGYGVYWEPVAKAAQTWRKDTGAFSGWGIKDLTREIKTGNPVVFWGVLPTGNLTDCSWYTLEGKYILAFKQTHVRTVIGFIGPEDNPSKIIINDPLSGRLYWATDYFLKNWKVFNYSGVVVK